MKLCKGWNLTWFYGIGSCTLAIVMLELFGPGELPGVQRRPFAMSDTASFREVYKAAKAVETDCLLPGKRPGWEPLGEHALCLRSFEDGIFGGWLCDICWEC